MRIVERLTQRLLSLRRLTYLQHLQLKNLTKRERVGHNSKCLISKVWENRNSGKICWTAHHLSLLVMHLILWLLQLRTQTFSKVKQGGLIRSRPQKSIRQTFLLRTARDKLAPTLLLTTLYLDLEILIRSSSTWAWSIHTSLRNQSPKCQLKTSPSLRKKYSLKMKMRYSRW